MTTITVTYGADDAYAFAQAHLSPHAWAAINEVHNTIRYQIKNGDVVADRAVLETAYAMLSEVKSRLEE